MTKGIPAIFVAAFSFHAIAYAGDSTVFSYLIPKQPYSCEIVLNDHDLKTALRNKHVAEWEVINRFPTDFPWNQGRIAVVLILEETDALMNLAYAGGGVIFTVISGRSWGISAQNLRDRVGSDLFESQAQLLVAAVDAAKLSQNAGCRITNLGSSQKTVFSSLQSRPAKGNKDISRQLADEERKKPKQDTATPEVKMSPRRNQ